MKLGKNKIIKNGSEKPKVFLPVYINKNKLLDINSILFDGYSEFSEETLETEKSKTSNAKAAIETGLNFSVYKLSGSIDSQIADNSNDKRTISLKKVQTNSSLLSNTIKILDNYKMLKSEDGNNLKVGDFVELNGIFKNNSICDLLEQFYDLVIFGEMAIKLDKTKANGNSNFNGVKDTIEKMKRALKKRNDSERELVYSTDECIYVVHLISNNIYGSTLDSIYNNELCYFGQIKEITNNYKFFADTQISKFNSDLIKDFIDAIQKLITNDAYNIDFELLYDSNNKKTIELDVIAIYRKFK